MLAEKKQEIIGDLQPFLDAQPILLKKELLEKVQAQQLEQQSDIPKFIRQVETVLRENNALAFCFFACFSCRSYSSEDYSQCDHANTF